MLTRGIEGAPPIHAQPEPGSSPELDSFFALLYRFLGKVQEAYTFEKALAMGDLSVEADKQNPFIMPMKALQADQASYRREIDTIKQVGQDIDLDYINSEVPLAIEESRNGLQHIASIIRAMKQFAQPGHCSAAPIDINSLVENSLTITQAQWKEEAIIKKQLADGLPTVKGLAQEIGQALINILVNAVQALAEGRTAPNEKEIITISTCRVGDMVEISIQDNGPGIPPEIQGKIFDLFFTTREVGQGTGQGLAAVYDIIVKGHNGTIRVDSPENKGATFTLSLPVS